MGKNKLASNHPLALSRRKIKKREMIKNSPGYQLYKGKVIVRNVAFQATRADIEKQFSKFGTIKEIIIPYGKDRQKSGFVFINFKDRGSANKAIKEQHKIKILGKKVSINFALSKKNFTKLKGSAPLNTKDAPLLTREISDDEEPEDMTQDDLSDSQDDDKDQEDSDEDMPTLKNKDVKDSTDDPNASKLYLFNLDFGIKEKELRKALDEFGPLRYCSICRHSDTKKSKGSAFIEFYVPSKAQSLLKETMAENVKLRGKILKARRVVSKEELPNLYKKLKNKTQEESDED